MALCVVGIPLFPPEVTHTRLNSFYSPQILSGSLESRNFIITKYCQSYGELSHRILLSPLPALLFCGAFYFLFSFRPPFCGSCTGRAAFLFHFGKMHRIQLIKMSWVLSQSRTEWEPSTRQRAEDLIARRGGAENIRKFHANFGVWQQQQWQQQHQLSLGCGKWQGERDTR